MMLVDVCAKGEFILRIIVKLIKAVQVAVPMILIVMVSIDAFKVVAGQADDKAKKEMGEKVVKRVAYAIIVYLIPVIINIIFLKIAPITEADTPAVTTTSTSWMQCWNSLYNQ